MRRQSHTAVPSAVDTPQAPPKAPSSLESKSLPSRLSSPSENKYPSGTAPPDDKYSSPRLTVYQHAIEATLYARQRLLKGFTQLDANVMDDHQYRCLEKDISYLRNLRVDITRLDPTYLVDDANLRAFEDSLELFAKFSLGNCSELTAAGLDYFNDIPDDINAEAIEIEGGDHVLFLVGKTQGVISDLSTLNKDAYFCDPWKNLVCLVEDALKINEDGMTTIKNYFRTTVYHISRAIDLSTHLPGAAYQTTDKHHVIHVREFSHGEFACNPTTGEPLWPLNDLPAHIARHTKIPEASLPKKLESLLLSPDIRFRGILKLARHKNFIQSFNPEHHRFVKRKGWDTATFSKLRTKENLQRIYHKKLAIIMAAAKTLHDDLAALAKQLGKDNRNYSIIFSKQQQLGGLLRKLKSEFPAAESKESYSTIQHRLRSHLRTTLHQCYKVTQCDEKEISLVTTHPRAHSFKTFFGIQTPEEVQLNTAFNAFNSNIKRLRS